MHEQMEPELGRLRRMAMLALSPPESLDRPAERVQHLVRRLLGRLPNAAASQRFLRGRDWLGHPLHPLLTDLVAGAWTVAWVFDLAQLLRMRRLQPGADAAIAIGLAAVPLTALAGASDWQLTEGKARRLGFVHADLNILATLLYVSSMRHRRQGRRWMGMLTSHLGFLVVNVSGYLGGAMVYEEGVSVEQGTQKSAVAYRRAG
ncbi:MAG: DUF2231 domain-containing protein [Dehalococcoidia bacterium]